MSHKTRLTKLEKVGLSDNLYPHALQILGIEVTVKN